MKKLLIGIAVLSLCMVIAGSPDTQAQQKRFAFITNGVNDFWILSQRGVEQAAKDFKIQTDYRTPPNGTAAEQTSIVEDLLAKGTDGIAITVIDPPGMTPFLNKVAEKTLLITHDSDAPDSNRICYLGTNNYSAGRTMGKLVKEVTPEGGKLMLQVGKLDVLNAVERRQGIIDELKGLPVPAKYTVSPPGRVECGKWIILDTRTDNIDYGRAKQNAEDALISNPDIKLFVGLWAYEGPMILSAVKDARMLGKIKILAFDELGDTLQGITDGYIYATVVQDPYNFGYRSMELLNALSKGDRSQIPANKIIYIPERVINKDNVKAFWDDMNKKLGKK
jgi:ribose transport system substrate-binding protein